MNQKSMIKIYRTNIKKKLKYLKNVYNYYQVSMTWLNEIVPEERLVNGPIYPL